MKLNEKHLVAFANCNAPIDQEGYLLKRGEVNKAYQKRWFVLKGNLLFYFEKKGDKEPIGVIILEGCSVELGESLDAFAFQIGFEGSSSRAYVLAADSQDGMEKWMKAVTCASYDYMKLMVKELQQQVDDLTAVEQYKFTHFPSRTQHEMTSHSQVPTSLAELTMTRKNSQALEGTLKAKRQGRINPFDSENVNKFKTLDAFEAVHFEPSKTSSEHQITARNFLQMHELFGKYIQYKTMQSLENSS